MIRSYCNKAHRYYIVAMEYSWLLCVEIVYGVLIMLPQSARHALGRK